MANKIKYKVSYYLIKNSSPPRYLLEVENTETNTTFRFNKPIHIIHICVPAMVRHLDKKLPLFTFNWGGF